MSFDSEVKQTIAEVIVKVIKKQEEEKDKKENEILKTEDGTKITNKQIGELNAIH